MAFSSDMAALYAIPVRRASVLPATSFRFSLTTDTLAVWLMVPAVGPIENFHLQVSVPCRAHEEKEFPSHAGEPGKLYQLFTTIGFIQGFHGLSG